MSVSGIVLDEMNESQIRNCGFTKFSWDTDYDEMNDADVPEYQAWCCEQLDKITDFSEKYMVGMEDAKYFIFSDVPEVIEHIGKTFPGCRVITIYTEEVLQDNYSLDYDYRRDDNNIQVGQPLD